MTTKDHYDTHLGNFYSWMSGDFREKSAEQESYFRANHVLPVTTKTAIDLGAGHGLQSIPLAKLGFTVKAIDFNHQLLKELQGNKNNLPIEVIEQDIIDYMSAYDAHADVIVCMGDTLTHLDTLKVVSDLISLCSRTLVPCGKIILSFRDLTKELHGIQRFIPVKSDPDKILTCFLEYFHNHVIVHDILHEKTPAGWIQKVSAYRKLRLNAATINSILARYNFHVVDTQVINRMTYIIGEKNH